MLAYVHLSGEREIERHPLLQRLPALVALILGSSAVVLLVIAPLAAILYRAFFDADAGGIALTVRYFAEVLGQRLYWESLGNTLVIAGGAASIATLLGVAFAWIFERTDTFARGFLAWVSQLPIFIPPFVGAVSWALLAAPRSGIMNHGLVALGLPGFLDVYSRIGMLFVIGVYLAPYVLMIVSAALRGMDPSLEEAAQVSGLTAWQTMMKITVPLVAPAILSGAVLSFTIAIGLFGTPVVLGWSRQILLLTSRIWIGAQEVPPNYGVMAVLSIWLLALSTFTTWLQRALIVKHSYATVSGKGFRPRLVELRGWRVVTCTLAFLYVTSTILAPIGVLFAAAMSRYTWSGELSVATMLDHLNTDDVWFTLQNSVLISVVSATVATIAGIAIAWLVVRTRLRGRGLIEFLILLPISVPGIAFGVGMLLFWIRMPLPVYGTVLIIVFAFVGRFTAYAVRSVAASLVQVHPELEESARVCGYGPVRTFVRVTFPLIRASIVAAWLLLFSFFMTELSMVVILYTASDRTFSVLSFEAWNVGDFSRLASYSLLQMAVGIVFMALFKGLFRNWSSPRSLQPMSPN